MSHENRIISNGLQLKCLFNTSFQLTTRNHQSSSITDPLWGNPLVSCGFPVTRGFPSQRANNAESVIILFIEALSGTYPGMSSWQRWPDVWLQHAGLGWTPATQWPRSSDGPPGENIIKHITPGYESSQWTHIKTLQQISQLTQLTCENNYLLTMQFTM